MDKIRICIADDHPLIRSSIKELLSNYEICGEVLEADNGVDALQLVRKKPPDLLLGIFMPKLDGLEVARRVSSEFPGMKIIILSMSESPHSIIEAFRAGATGFILKGSTNEEMIRAIGEVINGRRFISRQIVDVLMDDYINILKKDRTLEPFDSLTQREKDILTLVARGETNKSIAGKLSITDATVKVHRVNIMRKLNVENTAGMIRTAVRKGLVPFEE